MRQVVIILFFFIFFSDVAFAYIEPIIPYFKPVYVHDIGSDLPPEIQLDFKYDSLSFSTYTLQPIFVLSKSSDPTEAHFRGTISLPAGYTPLYSIVYKRVFKYDPNTEDWILSDEFDASSRMRHGNPAALLSIRVLDLGFEYSDYDYREGEEYLVPETPSQEIKQLAIWYQGDLYDINVTKSYERNPQLDRFINNKIQNYKNQNRNLWVLSITFGSALILLTTVFLHKKRKQ